MQNSSSSPSSGIGFCGLLAIAFIVLKLTGTTAVASWPWLWVLSPLWLPFAVVFVIILLIKALS